MIAALRQLFVTHGLPLAMDAENLWRIFCCFSIALHCLLENEQVEIWRRLLKTPGRVIGRLLPRDVPVIL